MEVGDIDSEDDWDMEVLSEIEEAELDDNALSAALIVTEKLAIRNSFHFNLTLTI